MRRDPGSAGDAQRRDLDSLRDILASARLALTYVSKHSQATFVADTEACDAVVFRFAVIGEASKRISESFRDAHPELPWREMRNMRNFLVHVYDMIDHNIVWKTTFEDLPPLVLQIERILSVADHETE